MHQKISQFNFIDYIKHIEKLGHAYQDAFECDICGYSATEVIYNENLIHLCCCDLTCEKNLSDIFDIYSSYKRARELAESKFKSIEKVHNECYNEYYYLSVTINSIFKKYNKRNSIYLDNDIMISFSYLIFMDRIGIISNHEKRTLNNIRLCRDRGNNIIDYVLKEYGNKFPLYSDIDLNIDRLSNPIDSRYNIIILEKMWKMGYGKIKFNGCYTIINPRFIGISDDHFIEVKPPHFQIPSKEGPTYTNKVTCNSIRCWNIISCVLNYKTSNKFITPKPGQNVIFSSGVKKIFGKNTYLDIIFKKHREKKYIEQLEKVSFVVTKQEYESVNKDSLNVFPIDHLNDFDIGLEFLVVK